MKRVREEVYVEAQTRGQQTNGRALTIGGGGGGNMGGLTTDDALSYLKAVKDMFQDKKAVKEALSAEITKHKLVTDTEKLQPKAGGGVKIHGPWGGIGGIMFDDGIYTGVRQINLSRNVGIVWMKVCYDFKGQAVWGSKHGGRGEFKHDNDTFLALMKDFKAQRVNTSDVIASVKELFKGYDDLLLGFNTFLPKGYRITLPEKKPVAFGEAIDFVNKIKARFGDDDRAYKRFLDILNMYRKEGKSISSVYQEVTLLFQGHEDLLAEFVNFLPNNSGSGSGSNAVPHDRSASLHAMHFNKKIKIGSRPDEYTAHSDQREDGDENLVAAGNSRGKSLNQGQWPGNRQVEDNEIGHENVVFGQKNNMVKGINELDLTDCVQCTPSYRHLPDDYPIPISSYRNSLGKKVLNDHWVSVTSGSEDYSFKHMRKNQYEESLFRCEDDRYELDMLLESVNAAIKRVETLLEKMNNNTISTPICIKEHLSVLNLRCIERLYGDYGLDVMEILNKNSHIALPVILTRLKQKQEEWARCRFDFRKVWADVYAKNHHKSLDHRSFYFKQQDSKNLSTKGLVAEIKDISDRKHKEDPLHAIAVGTKPSFIPDLEFSYSDTQVHADLYQLIKYYCEEICATEQSDKVMKLWVAFLEPMFGVPTRSQTSQAMIDVGKSKDNQEQHDACEAVKDSTCDVSLVSNLTTTNKENPTVQGSSVAQETIQQDKLHVGAAMNIEDTQPPKLVSPSRKDLLMEGVENRSDVMMGDQKVEREEGELSPTESFEQDNHEVYRDNDGESVQKLPDNVGGNKEEEHKAKSNTLPRDDENKTTHASGSKSGGQVSSNEEHKGAMNCDRLDSVIESENEAVGMIKSNESEGGSLTLSERYLRPVKPLAKHVSEALQVSESNSPNDSRVFYGNDSFYVLFRLHQMLYERIQSAKIHSERKWKAPDPDNTSPDSYARFMDALYNLLDGSSDNTKFEDECRAIIGAQSYVLFTLDKLVQKFVKHLHSVAADDTDTKLLQLYTYEKYRKPGRFFDIVYHENARALLHEQNIYRIEYSSAQTRLAIQLMNNGNDHQPEVTAVTVEPGFANYLQNDFLSLLPDEERPGLFLKRNKAKMSDPDESSGMLRAMEGLKIINEVECKMACSSSKVKYEPNTSDLLYRSNQRKPKVNPNGLDNDKTPGKRESSRKRRISRFHLCLNRRLAALP